MDTQMKTKHHRRPRSKGGNGDPENISYIPDADHKAWHQLFVNYDPEKISQLINELYLDPRYRFVCIRK